MSDEEKAIEWKKKKSKVRLKSGYVNTVTSAYHLDGTAARNKLVKRFGGIYKAKHIDTFAMLALERLVETNNIKIGDDIEKVLGL